MVHLYFSNLKFDPAELRMFPKTIVSEAKNELEASDLPPGYS
jgi:hypothetical protein